MKIFKVFFILASLLVPVLAWGDSLYKEDSFQSLVSDRRAYRIGDSITVHVFENSSASASADTSTEKSGGIGFGIKLPRISDKTGSITLNEDFDGKGKIQRSGKLLAQLTVTVQDVTKNGELEIKGQQLLEINGEKQQIQLEGRIRPQDITEYNTIPSSRIADAKISYVGEGTLTQKQTPGILSLIFTILGLL